VVTPSDAARQAAVTFRKNSSTIAAANLNTSLIEEDSAMRAESNLVVSAFVAKRQGKRR
jgi:hypothetical protein